MATFQKIPLAAWRAVIESAFLANSVRKTTMAELYGLSLRQPEVIRPPYNSSKFAAVKVSPLSPDRRDSVENTS